MTHEVPGAARAGRAFARLILVMGIVVSLARHAQTQTTGESSVSQGSVVASHDSLSRGRSLTIHPIRAGSRPFESATDPSQDDAQSYFGVLGAVNRPGVYVTGEGQLSLAALIDAAHGPRQDAAEIVSVIRNGRGGLKFRYTPNSAEWLVPGDVVVMGQARREPLPHAGDRPLRVATFDSDPDPLGAMRVVAFVGLVEDRPIVASVDPTLPQIIANLYQPAELIRSVRVIRGDYSTVDATFDPQIDPLLSGDVLVFDPDRVDRQRIALAGDYPPAISLETLPTNSRERSSLAATIPADRHSAAATEQSLELDALELKHGKTRSDSHNNPTPRQPDESRLPTIAPMVRSGLPAPEVPDAELDRPVTPLEGPGLLTVMEAVSQESISEAVAPSDLADSQDKPLETLAAPVSLLAEQPAEDPSPLLERDVPAPAEPDSEQTSTAAEDSFDPLVMPPETAVTSEPTELGLRAPMMESHVSQPRPLDRDAAFPALASKATALGISVLVVAILCFVASLFWSRLDESSGPASADSPQGSKSAQPSRDGRTLSRLIENNLPLIEEQIGLPERLAFHGAAIGRRRIRMDVEHEAAAPHFSSGAATTTESQTSTITATEEGANTAVSGGPTHSKPARQTHPGGVVDRSPRPASQGGLLERVLVAMEREKRQ